ncbi:hypothetical protein QEN19_000650 [Hanseniaspora menglaensis]
MIKKSNEKKLTFGRRSWDRSKYTDDKLRNETDDERVATQNVRTDITLPMNLDERIQRQYNLTGNKKQKRLLQKKELNDVDNTSTTGNKLSFQCYVCNYKFNNDLQLIEHWNTDKHIEKLMANQEIKFPVNYQARYDEKKFILKQHLTYLQESKFNKKP